MFPRAFDNDYRGHKLALWLFGAVLFMRLAMSANSMINGRRIAITADGIPLDTFPAAAAESIVSFFALLGLSRFMAGLLGVLVLIRYRSMVPLMFALFLAEHATRFLLLRIYPITRVTTPVALGINLTLLALMVAGLLLSLRRQSPAASPPYRAA